MLYKLICNHVIDMKNIKTKNMLYLKDLNIKVSPEVTAMFKYIEDYSCLDITPRYKYLLNFYIYHLNILLIVLV